MEAVGTARSSPRLWTQGQKDIPSPVPLPGADRWLAKPKLAVFLRPDLNGGGRMTSQCSFHVPLDLSY